jgi:hypothetical protein
MGKVPTPVPQVVIDAAMKRFNITEPQARRLEWHLSFERGSDRELYWCSGWSKWSYLRHGRFYADGTTAPW